MYKKRCPKDTTCQINPYCNRYYGNMRLCKTCIRGNHPKIEDNFVWKRYWDYNSIEFAWTEENLGIRLCLKKIK